MHNPGIVTISDDLRFFVGAPMAFTIGKFADSRGLEPPDFYLFFEGRRIAENTHKS